MKTQYTLLVWLLLVFGTPCFGQSNSQAETNARIKAMVSDKTWGLEHYIQNIGLLGDTLFSVHNCQEEFLRLEADGTYTYRSNELALSGHWEIADSAMILLRNEKNKIKLRFFVERLTPDSLVVAEVYKKGYFTNVFVVCNPKDSRIEDSRVSYNTYQIQGMNAAISASVFQADTVLKSNVGIELGYSKGRLLWNNTYGGGAVSAELNVPSQAMCVSVGGYMNSSLALSTHLVAYTNFTTVQTGLRLGIGYSPRKALGYFSRLTHLTLNYNFMFVKDGVDIIGNANAFTFTLRSIIAFKKDKHIDKRIVNY